MCYDQELEWVEEDVRDLRKRLFVLEELVGRLLVGRRVSTELGDHIIVRYHQDDYESDNLVGLTCQQGPATETRFELEEIDGVEL